jgi:membrane-bound metal-dependent hydrolase YbcI (DUF457 family)
MDPASHVVFATCLNVRLGGRRPNQRPAVHGIAGALGALSPDIDVILMPAGWDRYLVAHEIGTHSLAGATICGAAAAALVAAVLAVRGQPVAFRQLARPAGLGALSHVVADLLSGASIRLLWPLSEERVMSLGVAAMGDPVVVILFGVAALLMTLSKPRRRQLAGVALIIFALLVLGKSALRERAEAAYRNHEVRSGAVGDYMVEPVWGAMTVWRVVDRTPAAVRAWILTARGDLTLDLEVPLADGDATWIAASMRWETVRNFRRAHEFAFGVARANGVEWSDPRYCTPSEPLPQCAVWAGGEFSTPPELQRLIVRVGDLVQTR